MEDRSGVKTKYWLLLVLCSWVPFGAHAGIDHEWALDQSGIWARKYQTGLEYGVIAVEIGGALWLGNDNELGHTMWQSLDSSIISGVTATIMKRAFGRARPEQGNDPNAWFKGSCCYDAIARMKSQAHWQTDVIAGWALGTGIGYWTTRWKTPLTVRLLPGGLSVGLSKRF
jgi:undecaprenyl-diphosphatase